jgi:hypothetical protein
MSPWKKGLPFRPSAGPNSDAAVNRVEGLKRAARVSVGEKHSLALQCWTPAQLTAAGGGTCLSPRAVADAGDDAASDAGSEDREAACQRRVRCPDLLVHVRARATNRSGSAPPVLYIAVFTFFTGGAPRGQHCGRLPSIDSHLRTLSAGKRWCSR